MTARIAILGAGMLGEALLSGLLGAGHGAAELVVSERVPDRVAQLRARHGVTVEEPVDAVAGADTVFAAVKPYDVEALLEQIGPVLEPGAVVVSMAAGLTLATLESSLPPGTAVVRVMSNTPVRVGAAMSALSAGTAVSDAQLRRAETLLAAVGHTVVVPEPQQDAVTAVSGSGPAYFLAIFEAMIDAGVMLGLPRPVATDLVVQTAYGTAALVQQTGENPGLLREAVTSPGGTTARGLRALDDGGLRAALFAAIQASHDRSRELGAG